MTTLLQQLYYDWFDNKQYWFNTDITIDKYLCDKYFGLLNYNNYKTKNELIASIILYDQLPRHFCRAYHKIDVTHYSQKACILSKLVLKEYNNFSVNELCFIYLPFRHINDLHYIYKIITIFIDLYNTSINDNDKITCKKYITNTLNKSYTIINENYISRNLPVKTLDNINKDIIFPYQNNSYKYNIENIIYKEYDKIKTSDIIIVSLSGGVDSMVALHILHQIHKNIIAVHINYNNRKESSDELDFVNYYCHTLNIKLVYRTIDEITRIQCNHNGLRDLYEDITKKIRFDMYRLLKPAYILLGHNKNDCFENIITNIGNKNNYENLSGMLTLSTIDNLQFWRPMLTIEKTDIIAYANINNIPYLIDSTPKWSVRGKIRDWVVPALKGISNTNMIESFFILKDKLEESHNIIITTVKHLINKLIFKNNSYIGIYTLDEIKTLKYISVSTLFFQQLNIKVSYKTLKDFSKINDRKFILNKTHSITIKNESLCILRIL
jgi:tRNA(Ile)-lysidine synthetase-like protein|tara:strand:- start:3413 stop:4900 length:1488 start_codon:yes stop_codon:yes gene_type:complete